MAADLVGYLRERSIEARRFWMRLGIQKPYRAFQQVGCESGDYLSGTLISLPCSSHLLDADQERVVRAVRSWSESE